NETLPFCISTLAHSSAECVHGWIRHCSIAARHPTDPHDLSHLLCLSRERPRRRRAAEQRDEMAPPHSITSSARARTVLAMAWPTTLATLRLTTSSYLVGACTGKSAAFSPLKMRSTYPAALRN